MNQLVELLTRIAIAIPAVCFIAGLLITAVVGEARPIKILLAVLSGIFIIALIVGTVLTKGLLVYGLFQIVALIIILYFFVIAGAVCGGGIYLLLHRKQPGQLDHAQLSDYLPAREFAALEGMEMERIIARLKSGFSQGGIHNGEWYIHRSERTPESKETAGNAAVPLTSTSEIRKGKLGL